MKKQKKLCSVKGCGHVAYAGGLFRGLLCRACNQLVIGIIEKCNISIDRLRKYLSGACALKR